MRLKVDPATEPFRYAIVRQETTNHLIASLITRIPNNKIRKKIVSLVKKQRNRIIDPFHPLPDLDEVALLNACINLKINPAHTTENIRRYFYYCKQMVKIAGLYAFEDDMIRDYFFAVIKENNKSSKELKKALEMSFVDIFGKTGLKSFQKRIRAGILGGNGQSTTMAECYILKVANKKSLRVISDIVGLSKDTVASYINKVKDMPSDEKEEFLRIHKPSLSRMGKSIDYNLSDGRKKPSSLHSYDSK